MADVNRHGVVDVVGRSYARMSLDGGNGALQSRAAINGPRDYPDIVVADIDVDGSPTILTANDNGQVTAYTGSGAIRTNWPVTAVAELDVHGIMSCSGGNRT